MSQIRHLACPSCAGVLEDVQASGPTTCPYCALSILILMEGVPERVWIPPRIGAEEALERLRESFGGSAALRGFPRSEDLVEAPRLLFLPLYEMVGTSLVRIQDQVAAEELLRRGGPFWKSVIEKEGLRDKQKDTRVVIRDLHHFEPALLRSDSGVENLDREALSASVADREPFDLDRLAELGVPFEPEYSPEKLRQLLERSIADTRGRKGVESELLESRVTEIFFPIWEIFPRGGSSSLAYVDGRFGQVLHASVDEDPGAKNLLAQLLMMSLGPVVVLAGSLLGQMFGFRLAVAQVYGENPAIETADRVIQAIFKGTGLFLLFTVAALLFLGLFRRFLDPRRVVIRRDVHHLENPSSRGESFLDTPIELLEALISWPRSLFGNGGKP